jgi:hypothetical protein
MKQIVTIRLKSLKVMQIVEFSTATLEALQEYKNVFALDAIVESYAKEVYRIKDSYKKQRTNLYTEKIEKLDKNRENIFHEIWYKVKGFTFQNREPYLSFFDAAHKIADTLKHYGGTKLLTIDYHGKSSAIEKMVLDLNRLYLQEIDMLGLKESLKELNSVNKEFDLAYKDRNAFEAENKLLEEIQKIRTKLSAIYNVINKQIEILHLTFPKEEKKRQELIAKFNVIIVKYKALIHVKAKKKQELKKDATELEKTEEKDKIIVEEAIQIEKQNTDNNNNLEQNLC